MVEALVVLAVLAVPVPVAGAQEVVAQVEASAADVAGKSAFIISEIRNQPFGRLVHRWS